MEEVKPTVPRVKKNLRQLLREYPGWYKPRLDYEPRRSEDILKQAKHWRVWEKAWRVDLSDDPNHFWIYQNDEQWIYCGDGEEPTSGFPDEPMDALEQLQRRFFKAGLIMPRVNESELRKQA